MKTTIKEQARALEGKLIALRRDFHCHPESGWTEFRTTAILARSLKNLGYAVRMGDQVICRESMMGVPAGKELARHMKRAVDQGADKDLVSKMEGGLTGVVGEMKCGKGPLLVLRFDIDANDINEAADETHRPFRNGFASVNPGVMHACGHDGHIAIGLGTAQLLAQLKHQLNGTVRIIFQPGEEGVRGAAPMVDAGVLDGADYILGGHIGFQATRTGQFICGAEAFLATTKFDVAFTGVPAHAGGAPEKGSNALLAAACASLNLHAITRHSGGASRITVGMIQAGQGRNVIPSNALIKVETRGETSAIDAFMVENARNVISGAAKMYGVDHRIKMMGQTKSGQSSPEMIARVKKIAQKISFFNPDDIVDITGMRGSEDFAHMMTVVQQQGGMGTYFMIGSTLAAGHHNLYFDFDETCLAPGVEFLVSATLDLLA